MSTKLDWDETIERLYQDVPEAKDVNWEGVFRNDPKVLGDLVNDIIKVSVSQKGRPGKRSASSESEVAADLLKLTDSDYADHPLPMALKAAMNGKSIRQIADASGINKMTVHRLLHGRGKPATPSEMEALARATKKEPSYFVEYRAAYVCNALYRMLCDNSESAVVFYKKMKARE